MSIFANERVQIIGYVEFTYLEHLDLEQRKAAYEAFVSRGDPLCDLYHSDASRGEELLELSKKYGVPTLCTDKSTSAFMAEIIRWMNVQLAPTISVHGVLVDVFGEGVLIMGEERPSEKARRLWNSSREDTVW